MGESVEDKAPRRGRVEGGETEEGEAELAADAESPAEGEGEKGEGEKGEGKKVEEEEPKLGATAEIEDGGGWKRVVRIEVPLEGVKAEYEERFRELSRNTIVPGFRKGRAPRWRILKQYGEPIAEEVKFKLIAKASEEVFKDNSLEPVTEPKVEPVGGVVAEEKPEEKPEGKPEGKSEKKRQEGEAEGGKSPEQEQVAAFKQIVFDPEGTFSFQVSMEVKPAFELPEYKGLSLTRKRREVADERVESFIGGMRRNEADYVAVEEGGAEPGDRLNVTGHLEVVASEPPAEGESPAEAEPPAEVEPEAAAERAWEAENEVCHLLEGGLVGLPVSAPREAIEGMTRGEERTVDVVVPDNFKEEKHRGKDAKLTITLEELKRPELPPLTDESAGKLGFEDVEALRDAVRARLEQQAGADAAEDIEKQVIDSLVGAVEFELPEGMLEREARSREARQMVRLSQMGIPLDSMEEEHRNELRASAREASERSLKARLILAKIAEAEGIEVTDEDLEEEIFRHARATKSTPVKVRSRLERDDMLGEVREELAVAKVVNFVREQADIKDEPEE